MNYTQLRAFHAVAASGGLTKAGRMLNVTQPAITRQLKLLEEEHGVELFHRRGHSIELTESGVTLYSLSQRIFGLIAEAEDFIASEASLATGRIRVGADSSYFVLDILAAFKDRYPGMNLTVSMSSANDLFRRLREFEIDVAVVTAEQLDDDFFGIPYLDLKLVTLVGTGHPLYGEDGVYLKQLASEPVILRENTSTTRRLFTAAMEKVGLEPNIVMELRNQDAVRQAVAAGLGIAPELVGAPRVGVNVWHLKILDAPITCYEFIACRREQFAIRKVRAFFELAMEVGSISVNIDDILAGYSEL